MLQSTFVVHEVPGPGTLRCNVSMRDDVRTYCQQHRHCYRAFWQHLLSDEIKAFVRPGSEVCCTPSSADILWNDWSRSLPWTFAFFAFFVTALAELVQWTVTRENYFFFFWWITLPLEQQINQYSTNSHLGHLVVRSKQVTWQGAYCKSRTTPFEGCKCMTLDVTSNNTRKIKLSFNSQWISACNLISALCSCFLPI